MKKLISALIAITVVLSLVTALPSCKKENDAPAPTIDDYITVDTERNISYFTMPISKQIIFLDEENMRYLKSANLDVIIEADYYLTGGDSSFGGALWLTSEDGKIYLNSELIVDVPVEDESATVAGCVGHKHVFDKYCISE